MSMKIILLICLFSYSNEIFAQTNIINKIFRSSYEKFRESMDNANKVTRVRTKAELRMRGNEFAVLDFIGLVQQYGYGAEEYDVQTEDGYILKLHRISSSPCSPKASNKSVVFIQHGFAGSSDQFVYIGPNHDFAYMLADAGYDVWLGNARGNSYSRRHVKYLPTSFNQDFWKFNIDDIGTKDAPALIDNVLEKTNKKKLIYIGYSMGTTMNYMLLSTKPKYNDKIKLSISLAPVAYFAEPFTLFFKVILTIRQFILHMGNTLRMYEFLPQTKFGVALAKTVCTNSIGKHLCGFMLNPLIPFQNINFNNVSSVVTASFNGASINTGEHLCQMADTKKFRKFDFGPGLNQKKYNSRVPPEYNLSKISAPQALFYAVRDTFIHPKGAMKIKNHLKNVVSFEKVPESYKHFDFLWSKNARTEYFYKILNLVNKFS